MVDEQAVEIEKNARYRLLQSANRARNDGFSCETWVKHPDVRKMSLKYNLHTDILVHIGAWVWTFRR